MRHPLPLLTALLSLLLPAGISLARSDVRAAPTNLGTIRPPGGVPLPIGRPGTEISVDYLKKATRRLEAVPAAGFDGWVTQLERIMGKALDGDLAEQGCRTYFVTRLSLAFDDLEWNARAADRLFQRARSMSPSDATVWKEAFEALLKKQIGQTATEILDGGPAYAVPLVLIPVDALHEGQRYSAERGKNYLVRLKQLNAEDVSLWNAQVDRFGGTQLDAAVNLILLDDFFDQEKFQRDRFRTAVAALKK